MTAINVQSYDWLIKKLTSIMPVKYNYLIADNLNNFRINFGDDGINGLIGFIIYAEKQKLDGGVVLKNIYHDLRDFGDCIFTELGCMTPITLQYSKFYIGVDYGVGEDKYHQNYYNSDKD